MNQESVAEDPDRGDSIVVVRTTAIYYERRTLRRSEAGLVLESKFPAYAHFPDMEREKMRTLSVRSPFLFRSLLDALGAGGGGSSKVC